MAFYNIIENSCICNLNHIIIIETAEIIITSYYYVDYYL